MSHQLKRIVGAFNKAGFASLHKEMSMGEYLDLALKNPKVARNSWQMMLDMILADGSEKVEEYRTTFTKYKFFDDPETPIIGLTETKDAFVKHVKGAAGGFGAEKRVLLFHGPVGSSKSTICRLLKRRLEKYSKTDDGAWYSFNWVNLPTEGEAGVYHQSTCPSALNENPLKLLPVDLRDALLKEMNENLHEMTDEDKRRDLYNLKCDGELNPRCKFFMNFLLKKYNGDLEEVLNKHIRVVRKVYSEADRCGIATFQPKDEKNQDSTELTGDINFALMSKFGSDSDPRAFNFDGEFCCGNRGMMEFIEILKLDTAFLYDLLGASQEQSIKPKKYSQVSIDECIISHTNGPEYEKLKTNQFMEAFKDRTVKIDVPYTKKWSEELAILEKDYNSSKIKQHIAPHTLEIAALFSVLTRLKPSEGISLTDKAELYDGKLLAGWSEEKVKELMDKNPEEGMKTGVSVRYLQDKISSCLSNNHEYINFFMLLHELRQGLDNSALLTDQNQLGEYRQCIVEALKKLESILKNEVQRALVGDDDAIARLCANYIDNIIAFSEGSKIRDPLTRQDRTADEKFMRSIEEKIGVADQAAPNFRKQITQFMGSLAHAKKEFRWDSNPKLKEALEKKLFEDVKDHIKLSALSVNGSSVINKEMQSKIDAIKTRLINQYGYNEQSATDVLHYVGGIFARGDIAEEK